MKQRSDLLLIVSLFTTVLLFSSCENKSNTQVVIIEKTKTYHRANCPQVNMAKVEFVSLGDAKQKGMKPCLNCKPDKQ